MSAPIVGRWNGRLTRRELPPLDASIEAMTPSDRHTVAVHWHERAAAERRVGQSFALISRELDAAGAPEALRALAARAVDDERRHFELSLQVASAFAGRPLPPPAALPFSPPHHTGASEVLRRHCWVLGQCALNETFASTVLESSLAVSTGPLVNAALRELLADEVDHARLGWAWCATLRATDRAQLQPRLLSLMRANVKVWRETPRSWPTSASQVEQGALSAEMIDRALLTALGELVIPGFEAMGFDVSEVAKWHRAGAQT